MKTMMIRIRQLGWLAVLLPCIAQAQRHGRPDGLQNYGSHHKAPNPILSVRLEETKKWLYIHKSEMSSVKISAVSVRDNVTGATHIYSGVLLRDLLPNEKGLDHLVVFKASHLTDKYVLSSDEQAINENTLVAYSKDGVGLPSSYSLVVPRKDAEPVIVDKIASVKLGSKQR